MRTILLTGTRAPATLDLARRLWREGVRVIGADSMRFPLGRYSRAFVSHHRVPPARQDREGLLRALEAIVQREAVDVIWPTCEEVFHVAKGRELLGARCQVLCPESEVLDQLHHKLRFARWVRGLNDAVTAPESWSGPEAPRAERLVWKPCYSRFAARTRFTPPSGTTEGWMAQRFIDGREFCSWALCVEAEVRLITQYRCPARAGRGAGCAFEPCWSEAACEFTRCVARELNYTGSLAFDFMESAEDGQTYVLECNPRLTSGIHVLAPEVSLAEILSRGFVNLPPPQRASQLLLPVLFTKPSLAWSSPDVVASSGDTLPVWTQMLSVGEFLSRAVKHRISLLQATTWDIEFNGD